MIDPGFNIYDPKATPPTAAWFWSDANHQWRLPPAPFRKDRFLLHIPAGIVFGGLALALGGYDGAAFLLASFAGFLAYEITESRAINDKPYPDISGAITGLVIIAAVWHRWVGDWVNAILG